MRLLKQNKKLVDSEVEEAEDLIKDIRAERIQQKWIKESTGKTGGTDPEKKIKLLMRVKRKSVMYGVQKPLMLYRVQALIRLPLTIQLPTPVTPPDFLDESPQKIKLSPIPEMLADDNAEKEGTVKGEGNGGQNMNVEEKNGVTTEIACTENDKCENKTEVHSDKDENQSQIKGGK